MGQPILARQMDDWKLLPRPERMTELYFTDYRHLLTSGRADAPQRVAFTVHNFEHQTVTYHYALTVRSEDALIERHLGGGKFTLAHDHSLIISKPVIFPLKDGRLSVKVSLRYEGRSAGDNAPKVQEQSIHYWTADTHLRRVDKGNG